MVGSDCALVENVTTSFTTGYSCKKNDLGEVQNSILFVSSKHSMRVGAGL